MEQGAEMRTTLRTITTLIVLLVLSALSPSQNFGDLPLPAPLATVNIVDSGQANSPVKCLGTANAYVKPQPDGTIMLWVEEANLSIKNVSQDDIAQMIIVLHLSDVRGNMIKHIWARDYTSGGNLRAGEGRPVGTGRHVPGARTVMPTAEYDSTPPVTPKVNAHVVAVTFADGSMWTVD
jgi:hypothetical protein